MGWIGTLLIIAGISLDIFATMECQGALVRQVNKKHLAFVSVIGVLWQLAILFVEKIQPPMRPCLEKLWQL